MKSKNIIVSLKLPCLITIFSLFSLAACGGCGSKGKGANKPVRGKPINNPTNLKKVIVLFHGLNCPNDDGIAELGSKLGTDIKNTEIIILNRYNSGDIHTTQQAEEAYATLKKELEARKIINSSICLFGDSHGGLVVLELYRKYKEQLNIKAIITNHSPLEGAPGINVSDESVKDFQKTIQKIFGPIIDVNSKDLKAILTDGINKPVRKDLTKDSALLKDIKSTLLNIEIPVILLGGEVDIKTAIIALFSFDLGKNQLAQFIIPQLKSFLNKQNAAILAELETNFEALIGDKRNDGFIPTYSQIAESILENTPVNVRRIRSKTYHHFYGTTRHSTIYNKLVGFINQAFEFQN